LLCNGHATYRTDDTGKTSRQTRSSRTRLRSIWTHVLIIRLESWKYVDNNRNGKRTTTTRFFSGRYDGRGDNVDFFFGQTDFPRMSLQVVYRWTIPTATDGIRNFISGIFFFGTMAGGPSYLFTRFNRLKYPRFRGQVSEVVGVSIPLILHRGTRRR